MSNERYSDGFRRSVRNAKAEARRVGIDISSYPQVRELLRKIVPDFNDRFSKYDSVIQDWHTVRLEISEIPLGNDFIQKATEKRKRFMDAYENPTTKSYEPDLLLKLEPVLKQITNLVSKYIR